MKARENPFAVQRVLTVRYRPQGWTWDQLLSRLADLHYRAAIVGPQGSGKTTLLEDLEPRLAQRGFTVHHLRLTREVRRFPTKTWQFLRRLRSGDIILFDGSEQLGALRWSLFRWLSRRAGGLVITTHRRGRLPTLMTAQTSVPLLSELVAELTAAIDADLPNLFNRHRGNLRECLRELYDQFAAGTTRPEIAGFTAERPRTPREPVPNA